MLTKILVTGGLGNVGSSLVRKLVSNPKNYVVIVDNLITGNLKNLPVKSSLNNWKFIKADVNDIVDITPVFYTTNYDYVFHYAALVGVKRTLDNPLLVLNDINGFKNILNLCKSLDVKRVFFSSSSEVYGEPVEIPQREDTTPLNSRLPYSIVKNVGESFLKTYNSEFNLNYTILRFFNTYGPLQTTDFVITKFLKQALNRNDITIYGDGSQTRTFCHIEDNICATENLLYHDLGINEVLNFGSDEEITILDLAKLIIKLTKSPSSIIHLPPLKEGDMTRRKPDNSRMIKYLGRPLLSLEEGINKMILELS
jgi:UDP-glucose 4-epimerase